MAILPTWLDLIIYMLAGAGIHAITMNLKKYFEF